MNSTNPWPKKILTGAVLLSLMVCLPFVPLGQMSQEQDSFVGDLKGATWRGFTQLIDPASSLPVDIGLISNEIILHARDKPYLNKTSPTNIGLGFIYLILSRDQGLLTDEEAEKKASAMMDSIDQLEKYHHYLFNWYFLNEEKSKSIEVTMNRFISSLDNGILDLCLTAYLTAFPDSPIKDRIQGYLDSHNYSFFADRTETGRKNHYLNVGFEEDKGTFVSADYGLLMTEARMVTLYAILKGDIPKAAWAKQSRLVKTYRLRDGTTQRVIAPWAGNLYEALFADALIGGDQVAPEAFAKNARHMIAIEQDHGAKSFKSGVWGISNGEVPGTGRYEMAGIGDIAHNQHPGQFITPYAVFLALHYDPKSVVSNLKAVQNLNPQVFSPAYGFVDSIDPKTKMINDRILALDKGIEWLALGNYLNKLENKPQISHYVWKYFKQKGWWETFENLLKSDEENPAFNALDLQEDRTIVDSEMTDWSKENLLETYLAAYPFYEPGRATLVHEMNDDDLSPPVLKLTYDVSQRYTYAGISLQLETPEMKQAVMAFEIRGTDERYPESIKIELKTENRYQLLEHIHPTNQWTSYRFAVTGPVQPDQFNLVIENASVGSHERGSLEVRNVLLQWPKTHSDKR